MKLIRTYVVSESWENDTLGNADAIYNTVLKDFVEASTLYNVFVAVFENNNATNYKADFMVAISGQNVVKVGYTCRADRSAGSTTMSATRSMYASTGTIIKVYAPYNP